MEKAGQLARLCHDVPRGGAKAQPSLTDEQRSREGWRPFHD